MAEFGEFQLPEIDAGPFFDALAVAVRPVKLTTVALEAIEEVGKAHAKHGPNKDLADGTGHAQSLLKRLVQHGDLEAGAEVENYWPPNDELERAAQQVADNACAAGRKHTRLDILLEEAFEAAAADDPAELRKELIQVAAMALDWIVDIDDRATPDSLDQED